ncbi:hypothetical protein Tco_1093437, partial [Tanacetum coccineum]
ALDYSSPPLWDDYDDELFDLETINDDTYDDPFDSKEDKIKVSKLFIDELDPPRSSDFLPSLKCDSVFYEDFSEVDALPSTDNEDKVFNPGIIIHENLFEVTIRVTPDKNVKKLSSSNASLILEDFNPPLYELPFHKEVLGSETLLSFSSKNEEKVFNLGILTFKGVHTSLLSELSHRDSKVFKVINIFESPMEIFPFSYGEDIRVLDVLCLHFYPPLPVQIEITVHKELGDRIERAATTASSLEAEQDNDFLNTSHIKFALTENPTIYTSLIQQFWQTASTSTLEDGEVEITATIDGQLKTITEASLRRHLKLEDADGISSLPNSEIFEQLALMGYASDSDKLTFQKGYFSPQWRFLIHTILHCLSPKKTAWEQFSSNIATAIICLATNRTFNFSKMIFEGMVKNLDSRSKFLMYPRFIQILLNKHQRLLLPHKRTYVAPTLTQKLFSNMRRVSKGYTGVNIPLFSSMLVQGPIQQGEGSTVLVESHHIPITTPSTSQPPLSSPSRVPTPPHDSPLPGGHTPGSDEGSMTLTELTVLCTQLSTKVASLEQDLKQTKKGRTSADTEILLDQEEPTELVGDLGSGEKGEKEISTANISVSTASATPEVSTAAENLVYIRRSAEKRKDKGKAIMKEDESVQKKTKKQLEQERLRHEEAIRLQEQINEEERQRIARDAEIAKQLQEEFDRARQEQEVVAEADQAHDIDWSDPAVLRYHAVQNRSFSKAEVRKNMCICLKNQGGYKQSHFKGMKYEDIRPIFERVWDQNQSFVPMDSELEVQRLKRAGQDVVEEPAKRQRTREASGSVQEQTCEEPKAEELSQEQLHQMIMEIYSEDTRKYWKIIRVGGHTEAYQTFDDILKKFDRDDLDKLWNLVKERFKTIEPTEDKARELWVELKRLFEPDDNDTLLKLQRYMHDPLKWLLYDTCGVHHVSTERGYDIYMLMSSYTTSAIFDGSNLMDPAASRIEDLIQKKLEICRLMKLEAMMEERRIFKCWFHHHTTNGHQFTMSNRHQELASLEQTASGKDLSNPLMADTLAIPEQTATGKETPNPFMAAFWFHISNLTIESSNPPPVKAEVPSELPKVSLVNANLKKLKFHLSQFDSVVKKRTTPNARTEAQIPDKVFVITSLKNDLRKLKGKEIVDSAAQTPSAYTIVPGMFKLDLELLAPRSKPTGNKKNDRISQTPSRNMKNKVEAQPRKVNKKNSVVEPIRDVDVKHSLLNQIIEPILWLLIRNLCFDGVHDMCLLDFVKNVNSRVKSAKKHKKQNIWKPTGHVFT